MRSAIFLVLVIVAGALGYALGTRQAEAPTVAALPASRTATESVDWIRVSDRDLTHAVIFVAARDHGAGGGLDTLQALAQRDSAVARQGHHLAHLLGRYVVSRARFDPRVISECRPLFQAGCYHGVLEGYMTSVAEVDPQMLTSLCSDLAAPGAPIIEVRECAHGLGHGLLEQVDYRVPDALATCDVFPEAALREECYDGVFMQNMVRGEGLPVASLGQGSVLAPHDHGAAASPSASTAAPGDGWAFRPDDESFPCNSVAAQYQPSCWSYQPVALRRYRRDQGQETLSGCELAPAGAARERCYAGYGKQSTSWFRKDWNTLSDTCALAPSPYDASCVGGIVEAFVDEDWGPESALLFCFRVAQLTGDATACHEAIGERIVLLHAGPEETTRVCTAIVATRYAQACLRGAELD